MFLNFFNSKHSFFIIKQKTHNTFWHTWWFSQVCPFYLLHCFIDWIICSSLSLSLPPIIILSQILSHFVFPPVSTPIPLEVQLSVMLNWREPWRSSNQIPLFCIWGNRSSERLVRGRTKTTTFFSHVLPQLPCPPHLFIHHLFTLQQWGRIVIVIVYVLNNQEVI